MNFWEKLIQSFGSRYYGDVLMAFFELIAIITGLMFVKKDKMGRLFLLYLVFDFIILIGDYYVELNASFGAYFFYTNFTNAIISLAELFVYYYFFSLIIRNKLILKFMKISRGIFTAVILIFIISKFDFLTNRYSYISSLIGVLEFLLLIPPCFIYFIEIIKINSEMDLFQRPSFWVVTGIFFYSVISIPFYLIVRLVLISHYEYWGIMHLIFFYAPLTINFVFLTKAFLCKETLTK